MMTAEQFDKIQELIGVEIEDKQLLERAFTHSSVANSKNVKSNENLEFFGDAILQFIISKKLYGMLEKKMHEGDMSKVRSSLVSEKTLIEIVDNLGISQYLNIATSQNCKINKGTKCYSDLFESLIATIYIDKGLKKTQEFVLKCYEGYLSKDGITRGLVNDYKTRFQEYCQAKKLAFEYKVIANKGDKHMPVHCVELYIEGKLIAYGEGKKIKTAQMKCAEIALEKLLSE